jgi:hypothetical protein
VPRKPAVHDLVESTATLIHDKNSLEVLEFFVETAARRRDAHIKLLVARNVLK